MASGDPDGKFTRSQSGSLRRASFASSTIGNVASKRCNGIGVAARDSTEPAECNGILAGYQWRAVLDQCKQVPATIAMLAGRDAKENRFAELNVESADKWRGRGRFSWPNLSAVVDEICYPVKPSKSGVER
jgi:hypothetical protein